MFFDNEDLALSIGYDLSTDIGNDKSMIISCKCIDEEFNDSYKFIGMPECKDENNLINETGEFLSKLINK